MADYSVNIPLPDHKRGDRWPGIAQIGPVEIDGATPPTPLARVRMSFLRFRGRQRYVIDSQPQQADVLAPAVIDDPELWIASIPAVQNFLPEAGTWNWDIEFYDAANAGPVTLYKGALVVHPDV